MTPPKSLADRVRAAAMKHAPTPTPLQNHVRGMLSARGVAKEKRASFRAGYRAALKERNV